MKNNKQTTSHSAAVFCSATSRYSHQEVKVSPCSLYDRYLQSIEHGAGLLQRHCGPGLQDLGWVGDFNQPPAQLLHHFFVALPLANQTVDDAPPLLSSPNDALPLVTQQSQFQVELVPAGERKKNAANRWVRGTGSLIQREQISR